MHTVSVETEAQFEDLYGVRVWSWMHARYNENVIDLTMVMPAQNYGVKVHIKGLYSATLSRRTRNCGPLKTRDHTLDRIDGFVLMFMLLSLLQSLHVHIVPRA